LRKEKNTIKIKKPKIIKKKRLKMIKKIGIIILLISISACATVKEKASGLKNINDTCPPKSERTLKDILCKEPK